MRKVRSIRPIRTNRHTKAKPNVHTETLREAISEAYHTEWTRYSVLARLDKKDKAAGKQLARS